MRLNIEMHSYISSDTSISIFYIRCRRLLLASRVFSVKSNGRYLFTRVVFSVVSVGLNVSSAILHLPSVALRRAGSRNIFVVDVKSYLRM